MEDASVLAGRVALVAGASGGIGGAGALPPAGAGGAGGGAPPAPGGAPPAAGGGGRGPPAGGRRRGGGARPPPRAPRGRPDGPGASGWAGSRPFTSLGIRLRSSGPRKAPARSVSSGVALVELAMTSASEAPSR